LLEDAIIENKQAIEMASVYSGILDVTMEAFGSVISNNLNSVMRRLTSITIILSVPTMIFSFFGMNVPLPMQGAVNAVNFITGGALICVGLMVIFMFRNKLF